MKKIYILGSIAALLMIQLIGCDDNRSIVAGSEDRSDLQINIKLGKIAVDRIASAEVIITGSGWAGRKEALSVSGNAISGTVRQLPAGANRKFVLNCYDAVGSLAYTGETTADVVAGQLVSISIRLLAVSGGSESASTVVLTIRSPVVSNYQENYVKYPTTITGEIENPSSQTATAVNVVFTPRNASGGAMGQYTYSVGSVPPGSKFFSVLFGDYAYAGSVAPISKIDYVITHSLGGPDTGSTSVSAN
jgi:hypothetical protein